MYKPKRQVRLESMKYPPRMSDLRNLLQEAMVNKGCTVELPFAALNSKWSLTVRSEIGGTQEPMWTLYEGEGSASRVVWSTPFDDVELLQDVLHLSLPQEIQKVSMPPEVSYTRLEPASNGQGAESGHSFAAYDKSNALMSEPPQPQPAPPQQQQPQPAAQPQPQPQQQPSQPQQPPLPPGYPPGYPQQVPPGYGYPPGYQQMPYGYPPGYVYPPGYPQQMPPGYGYPPGYAYPPGYGYPPGYPQQQMPPGYPPQPMPPGYPQQPGYPPQPMPPDPGLSAPQQNALSGTYPAVGNPNVSGTYPAAANPYASGAYPSVDPYASGTYPSVGGDMLAKRPNFLLGHFLVEAGLIPEPTLDAALQLQGMVKAGQLNPKQAGEAVRRAHTRGGKVDNMTFTATPAKKVDSSDVQATAPPLGQVLIEAGLISVPVLKAALNLQEVVRTGALTREEALEAFIREHYGVDAKSARKAIAKNSMDSKVIGLLVKAGLLTDQDVQTAQAVKKKHGGDVVKILTAAGKLDKILLGAANQCHDLIEQKRLKIEQAIIALHYCERMRVSFDDAVEEMGWDKP